MSDQESHRPNGIIVTGYRILLIILTAALTLIGGLALTSVNRMADSLEKMRSDINQLRVEISSVRETLAGDYITREETRALLRELEGRLDRRIDRSGGGSPPLSVPFNGRAPRSTPK